MTNQLSMSGEQMELTLGAQPVGGPAVRRLRRPRRLHVARWWFARMRAAVGAARDWQDGGTWIATEQSALPLTSNPGSSRYRASRALPARNF
jgi:hypothetical protein